MKRSGPLARRTELKRTGFERKPRAPRKPRKPRAARKPRKPIRKVGARKKRERAALEAFRRGVQARALGHCELCGVSATLESHHLVGRGRAADWFRLHDHDINGMALCQPCHRDVTLDNALAGARFFRAMAIWKWDRRGG